MCPFPVTFGTLCISRYTSAGLFPGGQRIGGGFGTDDRKRVHGGSCGERGDHAEDAEMRPEQIPELIMRLESFQESAGRRETGSFHDARICLSLSLSLHLHYSFPFELSSNYSNISASNRSAGLAITPALQCIR